MLKVAIDARLIGANATGDSTYWQGLVYGVSKLDANVRLLLVSNESRPDCVPACENLEWITVPGRSQRWWSLVQLPSVARRLGAHVLHTQYNLSPLARTPAISTIHDVSFRIGPEWFKLKDRMVLSAFISGSIARAKRIITVSETSRSEIERFYPNAAGKTRVTYLAAGTGIEMLDAEQASNLLEKLGVSRPFILTVGTRWPRKNMRLAVEAVEGLSQRFPHRLVITGKAGWGEDLASGRAQSTGYVDESTLSALYSAADVYLAPSKHEGFGIPVLEAFKCGCPVIASTGGALPEVVGDSGIVVKSWSAKDWTQAIQEALSDSSTLALMRERGLARENSFTWTQTARATLAVYDELAP